MTSQIGKVESGKVKKTVGSSITIFDDEILLEVMFEIFINDSLLMFIILV
jgi:hypothetical protein